MGFGVQCSGVQTQNGTGMHHLRLQKPKNFWGEDPQTPLKEDILFGVHLTNTRIR